MFIKRFNTVFFIGNMNIVYLWRRLVNFVNGAFYYFLKIFISLKIVINTNVILPK